MGKRNLLDLGIRPTRFIKPISVIPRYENSDEYHMFFLRNKEEFIKAIWYMVIRNGIRPQGRGSWEQDDGYPIQEFFKRDYHSYTSINGIREFEEEDKYIMQYDEDEYDSRIYIIRLKTIKERYERFMKQFDDNYVDNSSIIRLY